MFSCVYYCIFFLTSRIQFQRLVQCVMYSCPLLLWQGEVEAAIASPNSPTSNTVTTSTHLPSRNDTPLSEEPKRSNKPKRKKRNAHPPSYRAASRCLNAPLDPPPQYILPPPQYIHLQSQCSAALPNSPGEDI